MMKNAVLPAHAEYQITAQRAADSNDPAGTCTFDGPNFSDLVAEAEGDGYPRIIAAQERHVTPWQPVDNYAFADGAA